jgi:hypothetical protein
LVAPNPRPCSGEVHRYIRQLLYELAVRHIAKLPVVLRAEEALSRRRPFSVFGDLSAQMIYTQQILDMGQLTAWQRR